MYIEFVQEIARIDVWESKGYLTQNYTLGAI